MTAMIIRAGQIITRAIDRDRCETIHDGAILVEDGVIAEVSDQAALARRFPRLPVVGTGDDIALPGFVNAHHHVGLTPFQLGAPDLPLELWAIARMAARDVDPYLDTLYSAFEMIASGVTTVQHICDTVEGTPEQVKSRLDAIVRAYADIGMRASVCYGLADQNHLVHASNATFLAGLPETLRGPLAEMLARIKTGLEGGLDVFRSLHAEHASARRLRVQLAPANLHWCSDRALAMIADHAERFDVPIHMHLLETPFQRDYAARRNSGGALEHLDRFALLGPRLTLGHGVWLGEADVERLADRQCSVCINCSSNLRLRSGWAPLAVLDAAGVNTAIGIDEAGLNDDRDMLQEMRLVHAVNRDPGLEEDSPGTGQILRMATTGGAATTDFAATVGAIRPGMAADITLMDRRAMAGPYLDSDQPAADIILRRARPRHVTAVICDGEIIYRSGDFTRVDRRALMAELRDLMQQAPSPAEIHRAAMARALAPFVRRFYAEAYQA